MLMVLLLYKLVFFKVSPLKRRLKFVISNIIFASFCRREMVKFIQVRIGKMRMSLYHRTGLHIGAAYQRRTPATLVQEYAQTLL